MGRILAAINKDKERTEKESDMGKIEMRRGRQRVLRNYMQTSLGRNTIKRRRQ